MPNDDAAFVEAYRTPDSGASASEGPRRSTGQIHKDTAQRLNQLAARLNASAVPEEEHQALYRERQSLLLKQLNEEMTESDKTRLAYVRWSLDRIDEAKRGPEIDALGMRIEEFEKLANKLQTMKHDLDRLAHRRK